VKILGNLLSHHFEKLNPISSHRHIRVANQNTSIVFEKIHDGVVEELYIVLIELIPLIAKYFSFMVSLMKIKFIFAEVFRKQLSIDFD
jgi:hypothetical protein